MREGDEGDPPDLVEERCLLNRGAFTVGFRSPTVIEKTMQRKRPLPPTYVFLALVVMALLNWSVPVTWFLLFPTTLVGSVPLVLDRVFIRVEERMLAETFGSEWETYCSKVRRWI
jgi:protein-S-isoprenylcysteine O-methyltransferase Ste14